MPAFNYIAIDASGDEVKGNIEADSDKHARSLLKQKKMIVTSISSLRTEKKKKSFLSSLFAKKISISDLASITRQISTLIDAGLPIEECLFAVANQVAKPNISSLIMSVRSKVIEGNNLADSMSEHPTVFDSLYVALVSSGEKSGNLGPVLSRLADYTENSQKVRAKILQALIYPIVLTVVAFFIVAILLTTVVPKVIESLSSMNQELPTPTKILITISDFFNNYGLLFLFLLIVFFFVFKILMENNNFAKKIDKILLSIPVTRSIIVALNCSRFAKTLSILLSSAVPLVEALNISSKVLTSINIKDDVDSCVVDVSEGKSLYRSLGKSTYFPPMMLYMIASGEKSGSLDDMLFRASENEEKDFEAKVNIALGIFEPCLVLTMAGAVLFIVMSIMLPIMKLNQGL